MNLKFEISNLKSRFRRAFSAAVALAGALRLLAYPPQDFYFHADEQYSVMAASDSAGAAAERREFGDFGEPHVFDGAGAPLSASPIESPWSYTARRFDDETTWQYLRYRYLDGQAGRFTTRDPAGMVDGPNLYGYVGNNPASRLDPLGLWELRCRYLAGAAGWTYGWHCWVECDGKSYSLLNKGGTATPVIDDPADKGLGWVQASGDNECDCIKDSFNGETGTYNYSMNNCNSNWYANSLLKCCGIDMGERVAWGWNDCSCFTFGCAGKPKGPGPAWTAARIAKDAADRRRRQEREANRPRCFVAGTLVHTAGGPVAIETICVGDEVLSWDAAGDRFVFRRVTSLVRGERRDLVELQGENWRVVCAPEHRFQLAGADWLRACDLRIGDRLASLDGSDDRVLGIRTMTLAAPVAVYNFEVEGTHTYCVTQAALVVHNPK